MFIVQTSPYKNYALYIPKFIFLRIFVCTKKSNSNGTCS